VNIPLSQVLEAYTAGHRALHALWSDAVGKPGYDKAVWKQLSNALDKLARDAATAAGHPPNASLF
jgi:hypothetical protein